MFDDSNPVRSWKALKSRVVVDSGAACAAACPAVGLAGPTISGEMVALFCNPASGKRSQALQLRL
jgi:hypothetical protein